MADEGEVVTPVGLKTRLKHLLTDTVAVERVQDAVQRTHDITTRAYQVAKHLLLDLYEATEAANNGRFDAQAVARAWPKVFTVSFWEAAFDAVSQTGGKPSAAAAGTAALLTRSRVRLENIGALSPQQPSRKNLSYVKPRQARSMCTAYSNNVQLHYTAYVSRVVRHALRSLELRAMQLSSWLDVPPARQQEHDRAVKAAIYCIKKNAAFPPSVPVAWRDKIAELRDSLGPLPHNRAIDWQIDDQIAGKPLLYLAYMVRMNRLLEAADAKLFSPLPLRRSFRPKHMIIDTQTLVELLLQPIGTIQQRRAEVTAIRETLELTEIPGHPGHPGHLWELPNLKTKDDFKSSVSCSRSVMPMLTQCPQTRPL